MLTVGNAEGVLTLIVNEEDLPFTSSGIRPDIIVSVHCINSRMTVAMLREMITGKVAALSGTVHDSTTFSKMATPAKVVQTVMKEFGLPPTGKERMYSGETGEMIEASINIGLNFYLRLKHNAAEKIHSRMLGVKNALTHQPGEGRKQGGGLKFGEMERDTLVTHGASKVAVERLMVSSDQFEVPICNQCGLIAEHGRPAKYKTTQSSTLPYCRLCMHRNPDLIKIWKIPYGCKLLVQELMAMNIALRFFNDKAYAGSRR